MPASPETPPTPQDTESFSDIDRGNETGDLDPAVAELLGETAIDLVSDQPTFGRYRTKNQRYRAAIKQNNEEMAQIDREFAPERELNKLITDDKEILGRDTHLGRDMRQKTRDITNAVHEQYVDARKALGTPRDQYLEFRRDRIALKVQRLERKVAENPTTLYGKHLKNELDMFKKRQAWRERQITQRGNKHSGRVDTLTNRKRERNERYHDHMDRYVQKQIEIYRKKEIERRMQQAGIDPKDPMQARQRVDFIKNLSKKDQQVITRNAILDIREKNIREGKLNWRYAVTTPEDKDKIRKIHEYHRATN